MLAAVDAWINGSESKRKLVFPIGRNSRRTLGTANGSPYAGFAAEKALIGAASGQGYR